MRVSILRFGVVILMAACALTACDDGEPRDKSLGLAHTPADLAELEGGEWVADSVMDPDFSLVPDSQIVIKFEADSLSADAGCNRFFGGASIDSDQLVVPALASTRKLCEDDLNAQDIWLSDFLSSSPDIEVLETDLWLSQGDNTVIHLVQE